MKKRWSRCAAALLALVLLTPAALAHSHPVDGEPADSASPWAKEEVMRWEKMGFDGDGGLREIWDVGLCTMYGGKYLAGAQLSDRRFSEDGNTCFFTVTLDENIPPYSSDEEAWHKNGVYHVTVDVDTCAYTLEREDLPQ